MPRDDRVLDRAELADIERMEPVDILVGMDRADFVHLVRLSEHASADDSQGYRRGVAVFAALGYLWVIACLALAVGIIAWVLLSLGHGRFNFTRGWLLLQTASPRPRSSTNGLGGWGPVFGTPVRRP